MDHKLQAYQEEQQQCHSDGEAENRHSDRRHKQPGENSIRCPRHAILRIGHLRLIGVNKRLHFRQWRICPGLYFRDRRYNFCDSTRFDICQRDSQVLHCRLCLLCAIGYRDKLVVQCRYC